MSASDHIVRDPDTGQVRAVNGRAGRALAWLRIIQPVVVLLLLPIGAWIVDAEYLHRDVRKFMSVGGRVYSSSGEPTSTDQLFSIVDARIDARVPPPEVQARLDALDRRQDALERRQEVIENKLDRIIELMMSP